MFTTKKQQLSAVIEKLQSQCTAIQSELVALQSAVASAENRVGGMLQKISDTEIVLAPYETACQKAYELTAISNDAQASPYNDLRKRLDAYDAVFKQFGMVIQKAS